MYDAQNQHNLEKDIKMNFGDETQINHISISPNKSPLDTLKKAENINSGLEIGNASIPE
jgi:hypothetical protein